jgi:hypothetical protein
MIKLNANTLCGVAASAALVGLLSVSAVQAVTLVGGPTHCTNNHCAISKVLDFQTGAGPKCKSYLKFKKGTKLCCLDGQYRPVSWGEVFGYVDCVGKGKAHYVGCDWGASAGSSVGPCGRLTSTDTKTLDSTDRTLMTDF